MEIHERIKQRRKEIGLSAEQVAEQLSISPATMYRYENNDIKKFPTEILEPLAKVLKTTPAYLMGWTENVHGIVENLVPINKVKKIPLLGKIACGEPILAVENIETYLIMPDSINADFALTCKGDSMIDARINDGDIVYIREQPVVENGEIAAVLIDGDEATLKRFYLNDDSLVLQPENKKYPPKVFTGEDMNKVKVIGKAVAFLSSIN